MDETTLSRLNEHFQLHRDLCFFDLEATGLSVVRDRIVQIAALKFFEDKRPPAELKMLINPGIPISEEAMQVHGILPSDLANKPTFAQVAREIFDFFDNADLAGYNSNRFDIPMLMEEFARVGMDFDVSQRRTIDAQRIFYKMEPRTLPAALKFYTGERMENAHDAMADVVATAKVLSGQINHYEGVDLETEEGIVENPIQNDMQQLHDFTNDLRFVDATHRLKYDPDGTIVFNFGKYLGQPAAEVLSRDKNYYNWILNKEFSTQVKKIVKQLVKEYEKNQANDR